jgi:hypothetical protein
MTPSPRRTSDTRLLVGRMHRVFAPLKEPTGPIGSTTRFERDPRDRSTIEGRLGRDSSLSRTMGEGENAICGPVSEVLRL